MSFQSSCNKWATESSGEVNSTTDLRYIQVCIEVEERDPATISDLFPWNQRLPSYPVPYLLSLEVWDLEK